MKQKFLWIILIISFISTIFAQDFNYSVSKPDTLYVGQPFYMKVMLSTTQEDSIFTTRKDTLDIFQIIDSKEKIIENRDGSVNTELTLNLAAFDTGTFDFPSLYFIVKKPNDSKEFSTESFPLTISSVLRDSTNAIADIAPMININFSAIEISTFILTAILISFLIWLIIKKLMTPKDIVKEVKIKVDNRPAYLKALELLEQLKKENLLNKGNYLEFYFRIVYILRFFLEQEFKFNAVEMTTSEIRNSMNMVTGGERTEILSFLGKSDQIKFAKGKTTIEKAEVDLQWLENYLKSYENKNYEKVGGSNA